MTRPVSAIAMLVAAVVVLAVPLLACAGAAAGATRVVDDGGAGCTGVQIVEAAG